MSVRAHVAKKYEVEFHAEINVDEFDEKLKRIQELSHYEDIVSWHDENHDAYELDKELLEDLKNDSQVPADLKEFAKEILDSCDPKIDYVRIEVY